MALVILSGAPGCRTGEVALAAARRLGWELVTEAGLERRIAESFAAPDPVPPRAWPAMATAVLAGLAAARPVVAAAPGLARLFPLLPQVLRVAIAAPDARRAGNLMLEERLDLTAAKARMKELDQQARERQRVRFGRGAAPEPDLTLHAPRLEPDQMAAVIAAAVDARQLREPLSPAAEAQISFQARLELLAYGVTPAGSAGSPRGPGPSHPSEELFANLLDFYGISWEFEPRSFPLQWDAAGRVTEAFTPDFYLPEFDLYIELTTMKQALVTKKNRKVKRLRSIYPHVRIQVFYQKDLQELVTKYGLKELAAK
jgi:cytidylate kinase